MLNEGFVFLVGAGPGDEKLITVKGLEVLRKADVVLYDRLVSPLLLQEVKKDAELIYCGKLPDRHILRQEAINDLLVEKAKEGHQVVRLKGGDPGVFGRVGEEALALKEAGIGYEIVPGITSGIAASLYAGIPVTHRDHGTSFTIVTGHDKSVDGKPLINWQALAQGIDTIAFYMGVKNLPYICENLILNGKSSSTKVAVIQWGTTSRQRVVVGTLETIAIEVEKQQISNPAITLVGDIVTLRDQLQWFEQKKLLGEKIIFPDGDEKKTDLLKNNGAEVLVYPKSTIVSLTDTPLFVRQVKEISGYETVVFTSEASVQLFFESLVDLKIDLRKIRAKLFYSDEKVKEALAFRGLCAEHATARSCDLTVGLAQNTTEESNYLATHKYENHQPTSTAFKRMTEEDLFTTIVFTSKNSVERFIDQVELDGGNREQLLNSCKVVCIGKEAFDAAKQHSITIDVFEESFNVDIFLEKEIVAKG